MSWKEDLEHSVVPNLGPAHVADLYDKFLTDPDEYSCVPYHERLLAAAACEADRRPGSMQRLGAIAVAYFNAHLDSKLPVLYDLGAAEAVDESEFLATPGNDPCSFDKRPTDDEPGMRKVALWGGVRRLSKNNDVHKVRINELGSIHESSLSATMQAITKAEYIQTWLSLFVKDLARTRRSNIEGLEGDPDRFFTDIYNGHGQGFYMQVGFARYAGFYEAFTEEIAKRYTARFGDDASEVSALVGATLFMRSGTGRWAPPKLREYKIEVLKRIDDDQFDDARASLQRSSIANKDLFNFIARRALWGGDGMVPIESVSPTSKKDYDDVAFDIHTAMRYCRDILKLTGQKEITARADALLGCIVGIVIPQDPVKPVFDIKHFLRHTQKVGSRIPTLGGPTYTIIGEGAGQRMKKERFTDMNDALALTMLDTKRMVTLAEGIMDVELSLDLQEQLISRLQAARDTR